MDSEQRLRKICERLNQKIQLTYQKTKDCQIKCNIKLGFLGFYHSNAPTKKIALKNAYTFAFDDIKKNILKDIDFLLLESNIKKDREEQEKLYKYIKERFTKKSKKSKKVLNIMIGKKIYSITSNNTLKILKQLKNKVKSPNISYKLILSLIFKGNLD